MLIRYLKISPTLSSFLSLFSSVLLLLLITALLILAATPPISRDALTHHLYIPKLWLLNGNIDPIPQIIFSYYPMNLDLLYTVPLSFGNDILPKYIHFAFALFTAWLVFDYLKSRLTKFWGLFGTLFFLSLPIIVKLSITIYVDLGVITFSTASLLMLFKWGEFNKLRYLIFAGIFCGLAVGTKYNGLITIILLTFFTPLIFIRSNTATTKYTSLRATGYGCLFLVVALLTFSPWMVRNYSLTGNPIYPLHNSLFAQKLIKTTDITGNEQVDLKQVKNAGKKLFSRGSNTFANRKMLYHETWWQAMLLPVRYFFEGKDDDPRYFDGKLNPFLLFFIFFAFYHHQYSQRIRREQYFLFAFGWLFFFLTFFQESLRIRYITTALPSFVILATFGAHNIYARLQCPDNRKTPRCLLILLLIITPLLAYNGQYIIEQFKYLKPFSFIGGTISRDDYITKYRPEYPIQKYANENLREGDKILAIYVGRRGYYFDFPVIFDISTNKSKLGLIVRDSETPDEIYEQLHKVGFTHLFIRLKLFSKAANENLSIEEIKLLNRFLKNNTEQLAANTQYGLFELHSNNQ